MSITNMMNGRLSLTKGIGVGVGYAVIVGDKRDPKQFPDLFQYGLALKVV